jgi:ArsR family transcriptional regulator
MKTLNARPLSRIFKALGDETRLRMVALLAHGELCVCHIERALELSQPNASRQLAVLKNAGLVDTRREGNWIHYRLAPQADPDAKRLLGALIAVFSKRAELQRNYERVTQCCGPR